MGSQIPPGTDLSKVPAGVSPNGVYDFDNPSEYLKPTLIAICALMIFWGTSFGVLRLWVNRKKWKVGDGEFASNASGPCQTELILRSFRGYSCRAFNSILLDTALLYEALDSAKRKPHSQYQSRITSDTHGICHLAGTHRRT